MFESTQRLNKVKGSEENNFNSKYDRKLTKTPLMSSNTKNQYHVKVHDSEFSPGLSKSILRDEILILYATKVYIFV